jgi:transposase-like protein
MMEMGAERLCAAACGKRSADRLNSRNGYRERQWDTRAGTVDLKIPKLRKGSYFPSFWSRGARVASGYSIAKAIVTGPPAYVGTRLLRW